MSISSLFGKIPLSRLASLTGQVIKWGLIGHVTIEYVAAIVICQGESMEPTLSTGDIIITEQVTPRLGALNRGDIVIARSPNKPMDYICKRVIAVSGDVLEYNSFDLSLSSVPKGHVWLQGDNTINSTDSRDYGAIPIGLVRGRVLFKIWPPTKICSLISRRDTFD